jgi:hypothetical protein
LHLDNTDLDTGRPSARGEYSLADATYDQLLDRLAGHQFADVPAALSSNIIVHYGEDHSPSGAKPDQQKRLLKTQSQVAWLKATCACR